MVPKDLLPWDDLGVDGLATIDIAPLLADPSRRTERAVAAEIDAACRGTGFFRIIGHGVTGRAEIDALARAFFAEDDAAKAPWAMANGGRAWRGWFAVGDELTSGRPDRKEGLYFGAELGPEDARVRAGLALHGANLFPSSPWRPAIITWIDQMTALAHALMRCLAIGLGLHPDWFRTNLCADPTVLLRVFHYPPSAPEPGWGVGEHTDYGLLTILAQDDCGGLQVHTPDGWLDVPAEPDVLVCNIGDMLDRLTGGLYRSTPHRVRNTSGRERISIPFFFDPSWGAVVPTLPLPPAPADPRARWDGADPRAWQGTYGGYLTAKVAQVFPDLFARL